MARFINLRNLIGGMVLTAGMLIGGTSHATDYYQPHCTWKTVIVYVTVEKPCVEHAVKYDHYGHAYLAKVVTYKTIKVPVEKQVKVCY